MIIYLKNNHQTDYSMNTRKKYEKGWKSPKKIKMLINNIKNINYRIKKIKLDSNYKPQEIIFKNSLATL